MAVFSRAESVFNRVHRERRIDGKLCLVCEYIVGGFWIRKVRPVDRRSPWANVIAPLAMVVLG